MRKFISLSVLAVVLAACSTMQQNVRPNYKMVDHKGVLAGEKVPPMIIDATTQSAEDISRKYFPDSYVFVSRKKGRDLEGLEAWSKNFEAQAEVAKRIQTQVDFTAKNSVSGNSDAVEKTMNILTEIVAKQNISGLQLQQDWWMKLQYEDGKEEFEYVAVFAIKKSLLDKFMNDAMEKAAARQELNEDDTATLAKLSEELRGSDYGLGTATSATAETPEKTSE
ncbi:MAG: hypothetical protein AAF975_01320 [Spirochaetota bacterium]